MRAFITGVTGFAGSHLVDSLLADGQEVYGFVHPASSHQPLPEHPNFHAVQGNILQYEEVWAAFSQSRPDVIYHLAGQASAVGSWKDPFQTIAINTGGTAAVLEAAQQIGRPRIVIVTSAQIYGQLSPDVLPLTEASIPNPDHPYGVSKWAAGLLAGLFWRRYGLPVIEARPFNHIGPRQALGFVVPDFASQLAAIKLGRRKPIIVVGNLEAERDFTDVRDMVRAYRMLADRGRPGQSYLICSGEAVSIQWLLDLLVELAGVDVRIVQDPQRMRPSETPRITGSYSKIEEDTGWQPEIDLKQSLSDTFNEWLTLIADE